MTTPAWTTQSSTESMNSVGSPENPDGDDLGNDAEGVWSPDIEQAFQEALAIYPPCGRRKIILSDEGKMYGRNELIARYIMLRTGKTRTRKQVSSHIQVLARRKTKDITNQLKSIGHVDVHAKEKALQSLGAMSSAQIVSATAIRPGPPVPGPHGPQSMPPPPVSHPGMHPRYPTAVSTAPGAQMWPVSSPPQTQDIKPYIPMPTGEVRGQSQGGDMTSQSPPWHGRSIAGPNLRLVSFTAFLEHQREPESYYKHIFVHIGGDYTHADPPVEAVDIRQIYDKFPEKKGGLKELYDKGPQPAFFLVKCWADLNANIQDEAGSFYGVSAEYQSQELFTIQCSTKVCSFGKQVVEKVETEFGKYENGRYVYRIAKSPMCEYMITFIHKLKQLPEKYMMNSVLENFTILQIITNKDSGETLLCIAFVFEVSTSEHGAQHHIYRLVKD